MFYSLYTETKLLKLLGFAYADCWFSDAAAHFSQTLLKLLYAMEVCGIIMLYIRFLLYFMQFYSLYDDTGYS